MSEVQFLNGCLLEDASILVQPGRMAVVSEVQLAKSLFTSRCSNGQLIDVNAVQFANVAPEDSVAFT